MIKEFMKYCIISASGKQVVIKPNRWYDINFVRNSEKGDFLSFRRIFLYRNEKGIQVGKPVLSAALLVGQVIQHIKGKKLIVLKTKPKKNYTRVLGYRSLYTRIQFPTF